MTTSLKRKGAIRRADVTDEIKKKLNSGELESLTLAELLVIDFEQLLKAVAPQVGKKAILLMAEAKEDGIKTRMALGGQLLHAQFGAKTFELFSRHRSDIARCWAAYALTFSQELSFAEKLQHMRLLADDANPGVREWAWMSLRPAFAEQLLQGIELLTPWTKEASPRLRRFATEISRPRGVWCSHIALLKTSPDKGLPLLDPLQSDTEKYVQDSVANWLNDAAKSQPEWVKQLCQRWLKESPCKATERICKRALRST